MKTKHLLRLGIFLFASIVFRENTIAQCGDNFPFNGQTSDACGGVTTSPVYAGQYTLVKVYQGHNYTFSTCGVGVNFDSEMGVYDNSTHQLIVYDDDYCGGYLGSASKSQVQFTSPLTGLVRVVITQWQCKTNSNLYTPVIITDNTPLNTYFKDFDGDGYGDALHTIQACSTPAGYVSDNTDCNDNDANAIPGSLAAAVNITNQSACGASPDGAISLNISHGSGQYNFQWSGVIGSGNPATTPYPDPGNVPNISGLNYGFYNVTITDAQGCGTVTHSQIHVGKAFLPVITTGGSKSASCMPTGSIIVYAAAAISPYTYQLDGGPVQANNSFNNVAPGLHYVKAIDARGCSSTLPVKVQSVPALSFTTYVYNASSCHNDGGIMVFRSGGIPPFTYSLDGGAFVSNNVFNGLVAGVHSVAIRDSKGCEYSNSVTVGQGAGLMVTANKSNTSPCLNNGTIQVNASGGTPPYSYKLDMGNAQSSNTFTGLGAGNYQILVLDSLGCNNTVNVTINVNPLSVSYAKLDAPNCNGTGAISLYISGGIGPFTYSLDGNSYQPGNTFSNVPPGTYTGYIKDSKTCVGQTIENGIIIGPEDCNNNVRSTKPVAGINKDAVMAKVYPNPSSTEFTLDLKGFNLNEKLKISVTDLMGRVLYRYEGMARLQYQIGKDLLPGVYHVTVAQASRKAVLKLVKE